MSAAWFRVRGQVQGVGFRPFVWRLARTRGLVGHVLNDAEGVLILVQGEDLDGFATALAGEAPALARIAAIERRAAAGDASLVDFRIVDTERGAARTAVTPDAAICADCRNEVRDPAARRYRYAFTNCTNCGPRFSIVEDVPYDRAATTMRHFPLCAACRREYEDPTDRRFHAEPIACAVCGPRLWLEFAGREIAADPIGEAAKHLRDGAILAVRGLGGFHIACDANSEDAVARLRARKQRPGKPFAVMAGDLETIARHGALLDDAAAALLAGSEAPVVLIEGRGRALAPSVAPGQWALGWMLPATPLHQLLLDAFGGPLIMTSGNRSGEPQAIGNDEARAKLGPVVDGLLLHDRDIARRLDDSVARVVAGVPRVLRRARGYAPATIPLPAGFSGAPAVAAYGGHLKAALCLTRDGRALLSHHLGDLDDALTATEFLKADADYAALFDHRPAMVACDLHPDYFSTRHAEARAAALGIPLVRVQHHHAHIAAVMAECGWSADDGPVVGVALDGLGYGPDGTVWGGEWLLADYAGYDRLVHLKPAPLPGGNAAQIEPWRNLMAHLDGAGLAGEADRRLAGRPLALLRSAARQGLNSPLSSSAGRLFDAVAAALGCTPDRQSYEGEAAMRLETLARGASAETVAYRLAREGGILDPAPLWHALVGDLEAGVPAANVAARFHNGVAAAVAETALALARETGARAIALTGGCFQNATLLNGCLALLAGETVLTHRQIPPNDGGLALGQAAVASIRERTS